MSSSSASTESKVSKNFRVDRLLRDSGNIRQQQQMVIPAMEQHQQMAIPAMEQHQQMAIPAMGNIFVPSTATTPSMTTAVPLATPPGGLPMMAQNAIESSSSGAGGGNNTSTASEGSNGTGNKDWRKAAKMPMPLGMPQQIVGSSNAIGMEAQQQKQRAIAAGGSGSSSTAVEKPFVCHFAGCQSAFADPSNCRAHEQTHNTEKPYICDQCRKPFKTKPYLSKHVKRMHSEGKHIRANAGGQ